MNPKDFPAIQLLHGNNLNLLRELADNSVDSIVTDPPYGISFMGRKWDYDVPSVALWQECLRVLKPGGHLLAFAGTRTQHRMAVRIEDAGFEIRDMIAWVYGSGFPKSMDVSKAIDHRGRGDMVRKKLMHFAKARGINGKWLEAHGVASAASFNDWTVGGHAPSNKNWQIVKAALGVTPEEEATFEREVIGREVKARSTAGASALPTMGGETVYHSWDITAPATPSAQQWQGWGTALKPALEPITVARKPLVGTVAENVLQHGTGAINIDGCRIGESSGRWPANLIHDGSEEAVALFPEANGQQGKSSDSQRTRANTYGEPSDNGKEYEPRGDTGSAARFFYCAKASKTERDAGLEELQAGTRRCYSGASDGAIGGDRPAKNIHPTVKPIALMAYLCRLITPPGGTVLDPFMGSGTTGIAAKLEDFNFIGMDLQAEYIDISTARISWWTPERWKAYELGLREKPPEPQQPSLFDDLDNETKQTAQQWQKQQ